MKRNLNQKLINLIEYYNLINANFILSNIPIKRVNENATNDFTGTNSAKLNKLKNASNIEIEFLGKRKRFYNISRNTFAFRKRIVY